MACRLPLSQILQRLTTAYYQGQPAGIISSNYNYSYVLGDTVPPNKFWVVLYASVYGVVAGLHTQLWAINPGVTLPQGNLAPYSRNHAFFQGDIIATVTNGPPVGPTAIRVDEYNDLDNAGLEGLGAEKVMLRTHKLLLPSGVTLMGFGGAYGFGTGGGVGDQFAMQVAYAEFSNDEISTVISEVVF